MWRLPVSLMRTSPDSTEPLDGDDSDMTPPPSSPMNNDATISMNNNRATNIVAPVPTKGRKKSGKNGTKIRTTMNPSQRRALLMADRWATEVLPTTVKCIGCNVTFWLDKRKKSKYCLGNWNKHCRRCVGLKIKQLELARRAEVIVCSGQSIPDHDLILMTRICLQEAQRLALARERQLRGCRYPNRYRYRATTGHVQDDGRPYILRPAMFMDEDAAYEAGPSSGSYGRAEEYE
jgi:hypothetical protein